VVNNPRNNIKLVNTWISSILSLSLSLSLSQRSTCLI
jgi:hypothetical protein